MDMSPNPHIGLKKTKERMKDLDRMVERTPAQPMDSRPVFGFQIGGKVKLLGLVFVLTLVVVGCFAVTAGWSLA